MNRIELLCVLFVSIVFSPIQGQVFNDVSEENGMDMQITSSLFGCGASFYDFNQDGYDDVSFGNSGDLSRFFINTGQGGFTELILPGVEATGECKQLCWVDYDNDHDPDLFMSFKDSPIRLYQNQGDLTFIDVSEEVGFRDDLENWGACWGDYDNNGWLDLYVCKGHGQGDLTDAPELENTLYSSLGNGTFSDATIPAQVGDSLGLTYQSLFFDYNQDGNQDLMVINDKWFLNSLYENTGSASFTDVGEESSMNHLMDAMCIAAGDYDNDLDLDVYISNTGTTTEGEGNILFKNNLGNFDPLFDLG
ncbi:MAG: VCBS repeat-containing protein, partial [Bacteroidota bacterium]